MCFLERMQKMKLKCKDHTLIKKIKKDTIRVVNEDNLSASVHVYLQVDYKINKWLLTGQIIQLVIGVLSKVTSINVRRGFLAALCINVCNDSIVYNKSLTAFCEEVEGNVSYDQM